MCILLLDIYAISSPLCLNANFVLSVLESNVCFNNSNNTNSDETLCECAYTKNNKSNIKYLEEITTDDLIPDSVN